MSRCFPYPPPGYEKSAALIESIKLQKDRERAEKERKKKEKKEKKSKSKSEEKKNGKKKRHREDSSKSTLKKLTTEEERSSLTEDHGGPATTQVPLYDSSDSTQDSTKKVLIVSEPAAPEQEIRKTLNSSVSDAHGSVVKIRLPLKLKQEESPTASTQPCFSGRTTNQETIQQPQPGFSGRQPEETTLNEKKRKSKSSSSSSGHRHLHRQYKKLVRDWNPPPLLPADEDLDWLTGGGTASLCWTPPPLPPAGVAGDGPLCRATYVPELGIHVLPYVVPF